MGCGASTASPPAALVDVNDGNGKKKGQTGMATPAMEPSPDAPPAKRGNKSRTTTKRGGSNAGSTTGSSADRRSQEEDNAPSPEEADWLVRCLSDKSNAHLFGGLAKTDIEGLVQRARHIRVQPNGVLFLEGEEEAEDCYLCATGTFLQHVGERDNFEFAFGVQGTQAQVKKIGRGKLIGDVALLFDKPRAFTVRAEEVSTAWRISRASYVRTFQDAAVARVARVVDMLRQIPFFCTADTAHLQSLGHALKPISLHAGQELELSSQGRSSFTSSMDARERFSSEHIKEGIVFVVHSGALTGAESGERVVSKHGVIALVPNDEVRDELVGNTREWEECRKEYMSMGKHMLQAGYREGQLTAGDVATLIEKNDEEALAEGSKRTGRSSSTSDAKDGRRGSAASNTAILALDKLVREHEATVNRSGGALNLVTYNMEEAPLQAAEDGARLYALSLRSFTEQCSRLHRLVVEWEDLRDHFAAMPYAEPDMFDDMLDLLKDQKTFSEEQLIMKQGERNSTVYLMIEGEARVEVEVDSGKSITCASRRRGDFFGERTTLGLAPRNTATVTAHTRCVCAYFDVSTGGGLDKLSAKLQAHLQRIANSHVIPEVFDLSMLQHVTDLGSGAFGTVMLMRHNVDSRPLALKCLLRDAITKESTKQHVLAEKKIMVELHHPFLVNLVGTFKDSKRLFMAMEYIIGGELFSYMGNRGGMLAPHETPFVIASVALMIEHIHMRGFVYRDLKPENLMITGEGYVKLIDFGFCKELSKSERTFTCVGTLEYMAPEVLNLAKGHSFEADWWSLGVLVYECFHACSPFVKNNPDADDREIITSIRDPSFPVDIDSLVKPAAVMLITSLLQHDTDARFDGPRLKASAFFERFDWMALLARKLPSPLEVEPSENPFDASAFDPEEFDDGRSGEEVLAIPATAYSGQGDWDDLF
jgi:CRP-like cAMP-binding protein